jgi:hypothetical protein
MILIFFYMYWIVAGLLSKFMNFDDDPNIFLIDMFWPLTVWYRLANHFLGHPIHMENYFLRI